MAIMKSKDGNNLVVDCSCGCDEGLRIRVDKFDTETFMIVSYVSGKFYDGQKAGFFKRFANKFKKIWRIITNKEYVYSEICMSKQDFKEFKEYLNDIENV